MIDRNNSGFTLIEIMVVMLILSIAFVYTVPKIAGFFKSKGAERTSMFNSVVADAYKKSLKLDKPIMVWGTKGNNNIYIGQKKYVIKNEVFSAMVNGKNEEGIKYYFFVYPSGIMDSVQIMFENNAKIKSEPLLLHFKAL